CSEPVASGTKTLGTKCNLKPHPPRLQFCQTPLQSIPKPNLTDIERKPIIDELLKLSDYGLLPSGVYV
ncbi:hypothetical protein L915_15584, partial [Phytophthora nicotianae]